MGAGGGLANEGVPGVHWSLHPGASSRRTGSAVQVGPVLKKSKKARAGVRRGDAVARTRCFPDGVSFKPSRDPQRPSLAYRHL